MATPAEDVPSSDSGSDVENSPITTTTTNPNSTTNFTSDALTTNPLSPPLVCLLRFAGDSAGGAFLGSIFGLGLKFFTPGPFSDINVFDLLNFFFFGDFIRTSVLLLVYAFLK